MRSNANTLFSRRVVLITLNAAVTQTLLPMGGFGSAARAEDTSEEEAILYDRLTRKKPLTRRAGPRRDSDEDARAIERLKQVGQRRGLNLRERDEFYTLTREKPQADLTVYFAFDSAEVLPQAQTVLDRLGRVLKSDVFAGKTIMIAGHTDAKGSPDYNQMLSERRAQAVRTYLVRHFKLDENLLVPVGYGFEKLKVPQAPHAEENRRVEIVNAGG